MYNFRGSQGDFVPPPKNHLPSPMGGPEMSFHCFETQAILAGKHGVGAKTKDEKHQNPSLEQKNAIQERAQG